MPVYLRHLPHPAQAVAELAKEHVISFGECEKELMAFLKEGVLIKVLGTGSKTRGRGGQGRGSSPMRPCRCEYCRRNHLLRSFVA